MTPSTEERLHHVVIIGGGFGGLYAAQELRKAPVKVTLIELAKFPPFPASALSGGNGWVVAGGYRLTTAHDSEKAGQRPGVTRGSAGRRSRGQRGNFADGEPGVRLACIGHRVRPIAISAMTNGRPGPLDLKQLKMPSRSDGRS